MPLLDSIRSLFPGSKPNDAAAQSQFKDSDRIAKEENVPISITGPQVFVSPGLAYLSTPMLPNRELADYGKYRQMRLDPTIALVRSIMIAAIQKAGWSYESDEDAPEGAKDLVKKVSEHLRPKFVKQAFEGFVDYGWQAWEIITGIDDDDYDVVVEMKPLLQEITTLLVDRRTGKLIGLLQQLLNAVSSEIPVEMVDSQMIVGLVLWREQMMWFAPDVEGTYWYGRPLLENLLRVDKSYETVEEAAHRYDRKIAGAHWVVHYPLGTSEIDGKKVDNATIAETIIKNLQSSGCVCVPQKLAPYTDALTVNMEDAWKIELLSAQASAAAQFVERQKYLDTLKVRAFGTPERSMLEGTTGTKAEAGVHQDLGTVVFESRHDLLVQQWNHDVVNKILTDNWGPEAKDKVRVKASPLADTAVVFLQQLYLSLMADPILSAAERKSMDMGSIKERVGVPFDEELQQEAEDQYLEMQKQQEDAQKQQMKMGMALGAAGPQAGAPGANGGAPKQPAAMITAKAKVGQSSEK